LLLLEEVLLLLAELHAVLGDRLQGSTIELSERTNKVLIKRVSKEKNLDTLGLGALEQGRGLDGLHALTSQVEDGLLLVAHALDVVLEGDELLALGGGETQELGELGLVGSVLKNTELDRLAELVPELSVLTLELLLLSTLFSGLLRVLNLLLLLIGELLEHIEDLALHLLGNAAEHLALAELLTVHVEGNVVGVDDTLDEVEVAREHILPVVGDHDALDVELEGDALLVVTLVHAVLGLRGHVENGLKGDIAFSGEVELAEGGLGVLSEGLVEILVLGIGDVGGGAGPDSLDSVHVLVLDDVAGNLLFLLGLLLGDFDAILVLLGSRVVFDLDLLSDGLGDLEDDREIDELRVLGDDIGEGALVEELIGIGLQVEGDFSTATKSVTAGVLGNGEDTVGSGLPDVLVVSVGLGGDGDLVSSEIDGVETDTELTDKREGVLTSRGSLDELGGTRASENTEVLHEFVLGHTHTLIADGEGALVLIELDTDIKLGSITLTKSRLISEAKETDLIKSISSVGDQLTHENITVRVERVNEDVHEAVDLCLELELLFGSREGSTLLRSEDISKGSAINLDLFSERLRGESSCIKTGNIDTVKS